MTTTSDRRQAAIDAINELWRTHEGDADTRCTAFVIDPRYVQCESGFELRLAASYGDNPFASEADAPPGNHLFGIHVVGILEDQITIFEEWLDERAAVGGESVEGAERAGRAILAAIPDGEYGNMVGEVQGPRVVCRSAEKHIGEFHILLGDPV